MRRTFNEFPRKLEIRRREKFRLLIVMRFWSRARRGGDRRLE